MSNDKSIWDFLKGKKLTSYAVAGIMGNLYAESGLISINLQNNFESILGMNDQEYTDAVDNQTYRNFSYDSAGYGLAQWTFWSRKEALFNYAKSQNTSIGDLNMQLNFFWKEVPNYFSTIKINESKNVRAASDIVLLNFERPADQSEHVKIQRAKYGQIYYDKFVDNEELPIVEQTKPNPFVVKINADALNCRSGPGLINKINGVITDKGTYTIIETSDRDGIIWGKLKSGVGWISLDYVKRL